MPEILEAFSNDQAYGLTSFQTEWLNCSSSRSVTFTAYSDAAFDMNIEWAVDTAYSIIATDTKSITAGSSADEISLQIKTRFCRFTVTALSFNPCILETQGFFFFNYSPVFENSGSGVQIFNPPNSFRSLVSTDDSVTITQNTTEIDFTKGSKSYGYAWFGNFEETTPTMNVYYEIDTAVTESNLSEFTAAAGRLTYTGATTKTFDVSFTFVHDKASSNTYRGRFYKNSVGAGVAVRVKNSGTDDGFSSVIYTIVELSTNDYVSLWVKNANGTDKILIIDTQLKVVEI